MAALDLLLIRHGAAEAKRAFALAGGPDAARPLTEAGRSDARQMAQGLARMMPGLGVLASSPLLRATETAEIIAEVYGNVVVEIVSALEPDASKQALIQWLSERRTVGAVAVVGHEPHLSTLAGWLLTGVPRTLFELEKGGACLIRFADAVTPGRGVLAWCMAPAQIALVGRGASLWMERARVELGPADLRIS